MKFGDVLRLSKARCADPLAEGLVRYVGQEHRGSGDLRIPSWGNIQFSAIAGTLGSVKQLPLLG
ncbi:MAG: hypothetical protein HS110_15695 [Zoogloeaceae bacterium]|nr:hypothetical protein [Zoogloeaceae bacterium]